MMRLLLTLFCCLFTTCQCAKPDVFPNIEDLFPIAIKEEMNHPPDVIAKDLTINIEKLNWDKFKKKLSDFEKKVVSNFSYDDFNKNEIDFVNGSVFLNDTRRQKVEYYWNNREWYNAHAHLVKSKAIDLMLQLLFMARHKIKLLEKDKNFDGRDTAYRIAYSYMRMKRILRWMMELFTSMFNHRQALLIETVQPFLVYHHKAVRLHTDFLYYFWVMVELDRRFRELNKDKDSSEDAENF